MDEATQKAFEAVYRRISQLYEDLVGDKDNPGFYESVRALARKLDSAASQLIELTNSVRKLTYHSVSMQNYVRALNQQVERLSEHDAKLVKKINDQDKKINQLERIPGEDALNREENRSSLIRDLISLTLSGVIAAYIGWWLGYHQTIVGSTHLPQTVLAVPKEISHGQ